MDEQKLRKALEDIFYLCHQSTARADNIVRFQALEIAGEALEIAKPWTADEFDVMVEREFQEYETSTAAAALGKLGGSSRSEAKQYASRNNGKKGGRPAKK